MERVRHEVAFFTALRGFRLPAPAKRARHELPRFPVRESVCTDSLMRRSLLGFIKMNLVDKESPRCLTLSADADISKSAGCCPKGRSLWGG